MKDKNYRSRLRVFCDVEHALERKLDRTREGALDCFMLAVAPILKRIRLTEPQAGVCVSIAEDIRYLPHHQDHSSYVTYLPQEMYMVRGNGRVECVEHRKEEEYFGFCIATCVYPFAVCAKPGDVPARVLAVLLDRLENGEFVYGFPKALIKIEGPSI